MSAVQTSREGRVLVIRLDRPTKRNAINPELTADLDAALNLLEDDDDLWCGVLTGGPEFFSAGADLAEGPGPSTERGGIAGIMERVRTKPLVAGVEGFAYGGGLEMVLCCDLVVAASGALLGFPEVRRGLLADFGGVFRAPRLLPPNVAKEMLLTGEPISAERAERLGFVNRVVAAGSAESVAVEVATRIAGNAPLAVRETLAVVHRQIHGDETDRWAQSHEAFGRLLASEDLTEGVNAFFERREPVWKAR